MRENFDQAARSELGAHPDADGTRFGVWAPRARHVAVIGDFNDWNPTRDPMQRGDDGVWRATIGHARPGSLYKFAVTGVHGQTVDKIDPRARAFQLRPETACVITAPSDYAWQDADWLATRGAGDWARKPMSIYEVHLGSWRRGWQGEFMNYRELGRQLAEYVSESGFTHVELLPVAEHPLDESWGYQSLGFFAPTRRFGEPDDLRAMIDALHGAGIGVILDWTPAHFPRDAHGLARFDGLPLYEDPNPKRGEHPDWGTLVFDFGRAEVRRFLIDSALQWIEDFHIDGLRVDAVASMLYLDYSREPGEWEPNVHGGRENLEALEFLRELNAAVGSRYPEVPVIAEESTSWPGVTKPTWSGGLGFWMKWDMGWMNDTLRYVALDPVHRRFHHDWLTFRAWYAGSERYLLPLSHDEVVHGKRPLIDKQAGDWWQRRANLRLLLAYQWTLPGKQLLFMGGEFAQLWEWRDHEALPWHLLEHPDHRGIWNCVRDLNAVYRDEPALHAGDFDDAGFEWIDCHDASQSVLAYLRRDGDRWAVVVLNFTPVVRDDYLIGVPVAGRWREAFNSDSEHYGGGNVGNLGVLNTEAESWMGRPARLRLSLPPLGALILVPDSGA